jgi:hypothetical protein
MVLFVAVELLLIFAIVNAAGRLHYLATGPRSLDSTQLVLVLIAAAAPVLGVVAASFLPSNGALAVKKVLAAGLLAAVIVALPSAYSHQYLIAPNIQVVGDAYVVTMCSILAIYLVRNTYWRGGNALFQSQGAIRDDASVRVDTRRIEVTGSDGANRGTELAHSIRLKKFSLAIRGYAIDDVDDWLENAAVIAERHTEGLLNPPERPKFGNSLRGYKASEVDTFVEETIQSLMTLN